MCTLFSPNARVVGVKVGARAYSWPFSAAPSSAKSPVFSFACRDRSPSAFPRGVPTMASTLPNAPPHIASQRPIMKLVSLSTSAPRTS